MHLLIHGIISKLKGWVMNDRPRFLCATMEKYFQLHMNVFPIKINKRTYDIIPYGKECGSGSIQQHSSNTCHVVQLLSSQRPVSLVEFLIKYLENQ